MQGAHWGRTLGAAGGSAWPLPSPAPRPPRRVAFLTRASPPRRTSPPCQVPSVPDTGAVPPPTRFGPRHCRPGDVCSLSPRPCSLTRSPPRGHASLGPAETERRRVLRNDYVKRLTDSTFPRGAEQTPPCGARPGRPRQPHLGTGTSPRLQGGPPGRRPPGQVRRGAAAAQSDRDRVPPGPPGPAPRPRPRQGGSAGTQRLPRPVPEVPPQCQMSLRRARPQRPQGPPGRGAGGRLKAADAPLDSRTRGQSPGGTEHSQALRRHAGRTRGAQGGTRGEGVRTNRVLTTSAQWCGSPLY